MFSCKKVRKNWKLKLYDVSTFSDVIMKEKIQYECSINTRKTIVRLDREVTYKNVLQKS